MMMFYMVHMKELMEQQWLERIYKQLGKKKLTIPMYANVTPQTVVKATNRIIRSISRFSRFSSNGCPNNRR